MNTAPDQEGHHIILRNFNQNGLGKLPTASKSHNLDRQDFYRYLQIGHHFDGNIKIDDEADLDLINIFIDVIEAKSVRNWCQNYIPVYKIPKNILHFILKLIGRRKRT